MQDAHNSNSAGNSADGSAPTAAAILDLAVGDTVKVYGYSQTGGTTTEGNSNTRFSAFLMSAF